MSLQIGMDMSLGSSISLALGGGHDPDLSLLYQFDKTLSLQAVDNLGPTLDIIRATDATFFDSAGVLQTAASGVARFDHDPVTNASLGLFVEEQRQNIALHNRDGTDAVWSGGVNMATAKDATGIDGVANSATTLTASAANARHSQPILVGSAARTFSIWLRRKTGSGTILVTDDAFVSTVDVTSELNLVTYTKVGDITTTQANPDIGVEIVTSGDEVEIDFGQVEAGAFSTSPIPTVANSVTRNADAITTTDVSWINDAGGTLYISFSPTASSVIQDVVVLHNGTFQESHFHRVSATAMIANSRDGNVDQYSLTTAIAPVAGTTYKMVTGYELNNVSAYVNGTVLDTSPDTLATMPTITELSMGADIPAFGGPIRAIHIAEIRYYNTRKLNQFLEDLSNGLIPA